MRSTAAVTSKSDREMSVSGHLEERQGDVRLHDDVADAVAQKDLHCDTGIGDLGVCEVYQRSGNAVAQLVGMRGVDFFKHSDSPSIAEAPRFSPEAPAHFFMIQAYHVSQGTVYPILDTKLNSCRKAALSAGPEPGSFAYTRWPARHAGTRQCSMPRCYRRYCRRRKRSQGSTGHRRKVAPMPV